MEPIEFRVGNLIYAGINDDGTPMIGKILSIYLGELGFEWTPDLKQKTTNEGYNASMWEDIDPILLTPEILEQCGFIYKHNHNSDGDENEWMEHERFDYLCYKDGVINLLHGRLNITLLTCLHELQNLIFALTGEELQIKLPLND